jgi:hypothetical protein
MLVQEGRHALDRVGSRGGILAGMRLAAGRRG